MNQVLHDFKFIYLIKKLDNLKEKKFGKTCVIIFDFFFMGGRENKRKRYCVPLYLLFMVFIFYFFMFFFCF